MRRLTILLLLTALIVLGLPLLAAGFALQSFPLVDLPRQRQSVDLQTIKNIVHRHNPKSQPGLNLKEEELQLMLDYTLQRIWAGASKVSVGKNAIHVSATVLLPLSPFGRYANLEAELVPEGELFQVENARIGELEIPDFIARLARDKVLDAIRQQPEGQAFLNGIQGIELAPPVLVVNKWTPGALAKLKRSGALALLSDAERKRLLAYNQRLDELASGTRRGQTMSMADGLATVLQFARIRSEASQDPVAENRAALVALGARAYGSNLAALLESSANAPLQAINFSALGRHDAAQHFLVSAAVTVLAGEQMAEVIGLQKEQQDAQGRSGFSFADLAADRAGIRLGKQAIASAESARRLQAYVARGVVDGDFLPTLSDLPESLSSAEFSARFGTPESPRYLSLVADIDRRIGARPVFVGP